MLQQEPVGTNRVKSADSERRFSRVFLYQPSQRDVFREFLLCQPTQKDLFLMLILNIFHEFLLNQPTQRDVFQEFLLYQPKKKQNLKIVTPKKAFLKGI